jgi:hypothetical protein
MENLNKEELMKRAEAVREIAKESFYDFEDDDEAAALGSMYARLDNFINENK